LKGLNKNAGKIILRMPSLPLHGELGTPFSDIISDPPFKLIRVFELEKNLSLK
jgi:hypothetical protein